MNLPTEAWYTRWFLWSVAVVYQWTNKTSPWDYKRNGTNLCQFVRVTWVWAPLIVACHLLVVGIWATALVAFPIYSFGFGSWGSVALEIIGFLIEVVVLVAMIGGVVYFSKTINLKSLAVETEAVRVKRNVAKHVKRIEAPSYVSILFEWLLAKKRKVCPIITFEKAETRHVTSV